MSEAPAAERKHVHEPWLLPEELRLAARNHAMPLEALAYDVTPIGLHYLLIHYDIPAIDPATYRLAVQGRVHRPLELTLDDLRSRPAVTRPVTLECAGNGRVGLSPRPVSQPWVNEAVGTAEWTGTPLRGVLEEAGIAEDAVEVVFTGEDRGVEGGMEQAFERSLPLADAMGEEVLLAYGVNGLPLPPQHGAPLRLLVPGWYGMASVKWLRRITVSDLPFEGYQMTRAYRLKQRDEELGEPAGRILPRALMRPPGVPEFATRIRHVPAGPVALDGRAWSGRAPVVRVEVSADRGRTWFDAGVEGPIGPSAWQRWSVTWDPEGPGEYELWCRATDASGDSQPIDPPWNWGGYANNAVQRLPVIVDPQ